MLALKNNLKIVFLSAGVCNYAIVVNMFTYKLPPNFFRKRIKGAH